MLSATYYSQTYASIIHQGLVMDSSVSCNYYWAILTAYLQAREL